MPGIVRGSIPAALLGRLVTIPYYPLNPDMIGKITATVEQRYRERITNWAPTVGFLSHIAPLDQTFVLPPILSNLPYPNPDTPEALERRPFSWESVLSGYNRLLIAGDLAYGLLLVFELSWPILRARAYAQIGILAKVVLLVLSNALFFAGLLGRSIHPP